MNFARPPARQTDETLALLAEGYDFMPRRGRKAGRRWFEMRLMLRRAAGLSGGDAPEALYAPGRFTRVGSLPPTTLRLLQDIGSVNQLDGEAHRRRKAAFMDLLDAAGSERLAAAFDQRLRARLARAGRFSLLDASERLLCAAALDWAGVPNITPRDLERRTREFSAMVAQAGAASPAVLPALMLRHRAERWAKRLIADVRAGRIEAHADTPLAAVSAWTDEAGAPLPLKTAAVELINLLRPTVAVARYVVFAAVALHRHPAWRRRIKAEGDAVARAFAIEVRRVFPFFPAVGGRVLTPFSWEGRRFEPGEWVLADLHGANHDPERWADPDRFDPGRFLIDAAASERVAAQGAGDARLSHRCPGEEATIAIVRTATLALAEAAWRVPPQRLGISRRRMPTAPRDGFILDLGEVDPPLHPEKRTVRLGAGLMAAGLAGLGGLILAAPRCGARLFGLRAAPDAIPYVRALAFRDFGVALALGLANRRGAGGLASIAAGASVIPLLDAIFVARLRGRRAARSIALHGATGIALAALALAARARPR
jgi:fatty-acid peroxygenase